MKKPTKSRPRGGASFPCPRCARPTRVLETRREDEDGLRPARVRRLRVCSRREGRGHRFETQEVIFVPGG